MMESVSESRPLSSSESEPPERAESEPPIGTAPAVPRAARSGLWIDAVYVLALAACGVVFLLVRKVHELSYPAPWPDEGSFLWPTLAFRDHGSLFSPELYPTREVFWMPPGFMVLEGCIFKLWTFSLGRARLLSAIFLLGAFGCVASMLGKSRVRLGHGFVLGIFLFSPIFQLAGNTARMEALVLLVGSAGFMLLERRHWAGLGLLALEPLVHPVGMLFFAVGCAYWFSAVRQGRLLGRADRVALGIATVSWLLYAAHVLPHLHWFLEDMAGQVKFKTFVSEANGGIVSRAFEPLVAASFVAVAGSTWVALRFGARTLPLCGLAFSSLLASTLTEGWLYDIYPAFGALLASLLVLESSSVVVERAGSRGLRTIVKQAVLAALVLVVSAKWIVLNPYLMRSVKSSTGSSWSSDPTYISPAEQRDVANYLRSITPPNAKTNVQFLPDADALLFEGSRSATLNFVQQTFYDTKPDVFIFHKSPWFPKLYYDLELMGFALRNGVSDPPDTWREIARGSTGSRWTAVRKLPGKIDWH